MNKISCKFKIFFNNSFLTLDLPKPPLFKDSTDKISIPQVSIFSLLEKYNGNHVTTSSNSPGVCKLYSITRYPRNLILIYKRFEKNMYFIEKNNTIINFPLKNLELPNGNSTNMGSKYKYNLLSNIIHQGKAEEGIFKVQIKNHELMEEWSEIQDLSVNTILSQDVVVSESYIHFYEGIQL